MKKYELKSEEANIKRTIEENVLDRNVKLVNLARLLNTLDDNFVISIDGDWGSGKTFFVKQLIYACKHHEEIQRFNDSEKEVFDRLSKNNFFVYYNAWENDDHIDPVESLIYNILNEFPKYREEIADKFAPFDLFKSALINLTEKVTMGIIKSENLEELHSYDDLAARINTIEEKKSALNQLLDIITNKGRIILVVDELDRCKPDYAVKMLETIKHFYSNPKITILVVTNNRELSHAIRHFYGNDFDGYGYLNKIYDTVITLEIEKVDEYLRYYCNMLHSKYLPENVSSILFTYFNFSYREVNKFISMYRIIEPYVKYKDSFDKNKYLPQSCVFLPIAIALKIKNLKLYDDFIQGKAETFLRDLFDKKFLSSIDGSYCRWFLEIFGGDSQPELADSVIHKYRQTFNSSSRKKNGYFDTYPILEALSMLGNRISISDKIDLEN